MPLLKVKPPLQGVEQQSFKRRKLNTSLAEISEMLAESKRGKTGGFDTGGGAYGMNCGGVGMPGGGGMKGGGLPLSVEIDELGSGSDSPSPNMR